MICLPFIPRSILSRDRIIMQYSELWNASMILCLHSGQKEEKNPQKYVGVQSWKAAHLPTLEIRVEQRWNRVKKGEKRKKPMLPRPGIEPGTRQ